MANIGLLSEITAFGIYSFEENYAKICRIAYYSVFVMENLVGVHLLHFFLDFLLYSL